MKKQAWLLSLLIISLAAVAAEAQPSRTSSGAWGTTWKNPTSSLATAMIRGQISKKLLARSVANQSAGKARRPAGPSRKAPPKLFPSWGSTPSGTGDYAFLKFRPVANSGVAKLTADSLGTTPEERARLLETFNEIKKSYETEVAKQGHSNNIAAALAFFMSSASMAYHQTGQPSETVRNSLMEILHEEMSASPDFKRMTDLEKQKMHDWLVVSGGFVLASYMDASQKRDRQKLSDTKQMANEFFKLVMGTGIENFDLAAMGATPVGKVSKTAAETMASTTTAQTSAAMHASQLVREFEDTEVSANKKYVGKRVRIYGSINSLEAGPGNKITLTFKQSASTHVNARCYFDKSQSAQIAAMDPNDEVTVQGTVQKYGGGVFGVKAVVILDNCVIP